MQHKGSRFQGRFVIREILLIGLCLSPVTACKSSLAAQGDLSSTVGLPSGSTSEMTESKFNEALADGAQKALKLFDARDFDSLFGAEARKQLEKNNRENFIQWIHFRVSTDWAWRRSTISPIWLSTVDNGWLPAGGMVILSKNIFPEGYYRTYADTVPLSHLMTKTPWLEWDDASSTYIPRQGGAPQKILEIFFQLRGSGDSFTLYRGGEWANLTLPNADRDPYLTGKSEGNSLIIFSTPAVNTALVWSHPSLHRSNIPRNELLSRSQGEKPTIYVGFEFEYPEIAFLHTSTAKESFIAENRAELMCVKRNSYDDPDLKPELKRDIDGALRRGAKFCDTSWFPGFTSGFPSTQNPAFTKYASVKQDGFFKGTPIQDKDIPEGFIPCSVTAGMTIMYSMAFKSKNNQIQMHVVPEPEAWKCPPSTKPAIMYIDADKIDVETDSF